MKKNIKSLIRQNWGQIIAIILSLLVSVLLLYCNASKPSFLEASLVDIATIFFACFITFYLTEKINDNRRRNDCIEQVITEIEKMVIDEAIFAKSEWTFIYQASCANKIRYLKEAGFSCIQEDIDFIATHFQEIRELYSNHRNSQKELDVVKKDFQRLQSLICDKCTKIRIALYK